MMFLTSPGYNYGSPDNVVDVVSTEFSGSTNRISFQQIYIVHQYFTCKLFRQFPTL